MTQIRKVKRIERVINLILWYETQSFLCYGNSKIKIIVPSRKAKTGFGNWILGFEIYL